MRNSDLELSAGPGEVTIMTSYKAEDVEGDCAYIVDTNDEYDVRNLFERRDYKDKRVELRQQAADRRLSVRLKTISIYYI